MRSANPSLDECIQLLRDTRDHEFLFGAEVGVFINEVYNKAVLRNAQRAMGPHTAQQLAKTLNWFAPRMGEPRKAFLKYLNLRKP
jgi:hypothetical protein